MNDPMIMADEKVAMQEIQKINNQIEEELGKPNSNKKKVYDLRFQQLMKGIMMTQNPYYNTL